MLRPLPKRFADLSTEEWTNTLIRSIDEPLIDGIEFPTFPAANLQEQFVGSSFAPAMREAADFYAYVKDVAARHGMPITDESRLLDFGCGWGRFLRLFWRDVDPSRLTGVDTDPEILDVCRASNIQAVLKRIEPLGNLDLPDGSQSHIIAYSVFTHLPENVQHHWLRELHRVAAEHCVFVCTVEPRRFLSFVAGLGEDATSGWHQSLRQAAGDVEDKLRQFDSGQFVYIPTGGGNYRDASVYGDAVISKRYVDREWSRYFSVRAYDEDRFWQAAVVLQKEAPSGLAGTWRRVRDAVRR